MTTRARVVFKPTVQHNAIFTFDDREQEIIDFSFANIPCYAEYELNISDKLF